VVLVEKEDGNISPALLTMLREKAKTDYWPLKHSIVLVSFYIPLFQLI
jgi:hypothetical protein